MYGRYDDDDEYRERERPSWREIDRRRDRSRHVRPDHEVYKKKKVRTTGQAQYKAALEAFFSGGKLPERFASAMKIQLKDSKGSERQKLVQAIIDAPTITELEKLYDEFIKKWELPDDVDMLSSLLRHRDESVVKRCLERLSKIVGKKIIKRRNLLESRLKDLIDLTDDPEIVELSKKVLKLIPKV